MIISPQVKTSPGPHTACRQTLISCSNSWLPLFKKVQPNLEEHMLDYRLTCREDERFLRASTPAPDSDTNNSPATIANITTRKWAKRLQGSNLTLPDTNPGRNNKLWGSVWTMLLVFHLQNQRCVQPPDIFLAHREEKLVDSHRLESLTPRIGGKYSSYQLL